MGGQHDCPQRNAAVAHLHGFTGVRAEKHKILWNHWDPARGIVAVPTVFSEAKQIGLSTAMFVGKEKFRHLVQTNSVDVFDYNRAESGACHITGAYGGNENAKGRHCLCPGRRPGCRRLYCQKQA